MKNLMSQVSVLCLVLLSTSAVKAEISVIVHPDNAIAAMDKKAVKKIFLGKSKKFPGGSSAQPIDQSGGTSKKAFHSTITKKNAAKLKAYWSRMVFTGKAQPPKEVSDDAAVIAAVAANPKAVGYVDSASVDGSVKAILTIP